MNILQNTLRFFMLAALVVVLGSCEKLLERKPDELTPDEAIQSPEDLQEVVNSIYDVMANTYNGGVQNLGELLSDNLSRPVQNDDYTEIWNRLTIAFNGTSNGQFDQFAFMVFRANSVLEAMELISLTPEQEQRFEAEARFLRGMALFDCVRLWAQPHGFTPDNSHPGIAIRLGTLPEIVTTRPTVGQVYAQVLDDINFANANLPESNGIYATTWSAKALLARIYFQMRDYERAASFASEVIDSSPFSLGSDTTFYTWPQSSPEAILQVYSAPRGDGVSDNRSGTLRGNYSSLGNTTLRLDPDFYNSLVSQGGPRATLFEVQLQDETETYVTNMFNEINFHIPLLTITEMHLTRAEALAYLGTDLATAINDVNTLIERSLGSTVFNLPPNADVEAIKQAARAERRFNLAFTGDRVQQLKRRGVEGENIIIRGAPWDCPGMVLQLPQTEQVDGFPLNPSGGC